MINGKRIVVIIQARMNSGRLPGKILQDIAGKTLLERIVLRARSANLADEIVVATTNTPADNPTAIEAARLGASVFRGDEHDVLARFLGAATAARADVVVRVCADQPLLDGNAIDDCALAVAKQLFDYATTDHADGAPKGTAPEAFTFKALKEAAAKAKTKREREHVTPFIRESKQFRKKQVAVPRWMQKNVVLCIDTPQDLNFIRKLFASVKGAGNGRQGLRKAIQYAQKHRQITVAFLTEARRERGVGHAMRSVASALALRELAPKTKIVFLVNPDGPAMQIAKSNGLDAVEVEFDGISRPNAHSVLGAVISHAVDVLVTDVFMLDWRIASHCVAGRTNVLAVDDYGDRQVYAKTVVNTTIIKDRHHYPKNALFPKQRILVGPNFMPVRGEVLAEKKKAGLRKKVENILVTMGGGDPNWRTPAAIRAVKQTLEKLGKDASKIKVSVVVGVAFDAKLATQIHAFASQNKAFHVVKGGKDLHRHLSKADVVFNAGGVTMYETAFLGIPQIVMPNLYQHEGRAASEFARRGAGFNAGYSQRKAAEYLASLLGSFKLRRAMSIAGRKIIDGTGAQRIAKEILLLA